MSAGPAFGSRSRWRTLRPRRTSTTGRTTTRKKSWRRSLIIGPRSASSIEIADDVEEQRRRVGEAVEPVEDAAMAGEDAAAVLDAEVALQSRDGDVAGEAGEAEKAADEKRRPRRHRRQPWRHRGREQRRAGDAAEDAGPGLARADLGNDLPTADRFPPNVLGDIIGLGENDDEKQEPGAAGGGIDRIGQDE